MLHNKGDATALLDDMVKSHPLWTLTGWRGSGVILTSLHKQTRTNRDLCFLFSLSKMKTFFQPSDVSNLPP